MAGELSGEVGKDIYRNEIICDILAAACNDSKKSQESSNHSFIILLKLLINLFNNPRPKYIFEVEEVDIYRFGNGFGTLQFYAAVSDDLVCEHQGNEEEKLPRKRLVIFRVSP